MDAVHLEIPLTDRTSWSFAQLLDSHLFKWGTRPDGTPKRPGKPWTAKEFDAAVLSTGSGPREGHRVRRWLQGTLPGFLAEIEQELFGENPEYDGWRLELRAAHQREQTSTEDDLSRPPAAAAAGFRSHPAHQRQFRPRSHSRDAAGRITSATTCALSG